MPCPEPLPTCCIDLPFEPESLAFTGGRADLGGLTAGATIWVRVRKIGTKGETGGWSDPASIMVT